MSPKTKTQNYLPQVATAAALAAAAAAIEKKPENGSHSGESNKHQNKKQTKETRNTTLIGILYMYIVKNLLKLVRVEGNI